MIRQFGTRNFKALLNVDIDLTPFHALIGPNDSGKTSILQAIGALSRLSDHTLDECFLGPWTGRELVWHGDAVRNVELSAVIADGEKNVEYSIDLEFARGRARGVTVVGERLQVGGVPIETPALYNNQNVVFRFSSGLPLPTTEGLRQAAQVLYKSLAGIQECHWNSSFLAAPAALDSSRRFRLDPSGFGLASILDDVLGYDRSLFSSIEGRFTCIFPDIKSIKLIPEKAYKTTPDVTRPVPLLQRAEGKGIYFEFSGKSELVPASQISDGSLIILAFLTVANLPKPPSFILVEEPENGIHPKRLKQVLELLRGLTEREEPIQVIITTHSPYVLDFLKPEEVTLCQRATDGFITTARLSDSPTVREQIDIFGLGEIWTSEGDEGLARTVGISGEKKIEAVTPETEPAA